MYSGKAEKLMESGKVSVGDVVILQTVAGPVEGIIMPKHEFGDGDSIVIKRKDGYNLGISCDKITSIRKISGKPVHEKASTKPRQPDPEKKTISILHTGGTIASRVDYETGGVVSSFGPEELLQMYPELAQLANVKSRLISNIFSEDMRFEHYQEMAKAVSEEIAGGSDGIIITHGTDTMHYTSAALAFMLGNLPVPVVLVGAQRSSDRGSSDAFVNLIAAAKFISCTDFSGVSICMHENLDDENCLILPACRSRKLHSCRRDAFRSIDVKPVARVGNEIEFFSPYEKCDKSRKLELRVGMDSSVGIVRIHPGMMPEVLRPFSKCRALVIEGTGLGHAPAGHGNEKFFEAVKRISKKTMVFMTTQTIFGPVNMKVYSTGRKYIDIGVVPCPMTTETAFIKISWILGNYPGAARDELEGLMMKDFHGEISSRNEVLECGIGNQ